MPRIEGKTGLVDVRSTEELGVTPKAEELRKSSTPPDIARLVQPEEIRLIGGQERQQLADQLRLAVPFNQNPFSAAQGGFVSRNAHSFSMKSQGDKSSAIATHLKTAGGFSKEAHSYMLACKERVGQMVKLLQENYLPQKAEIDKHVMASREG